uniref:Uncharacterized protein n=1 Tax=Ananas comosus var. bracteatus TaxID=296719 RepID=A0A6V7PAF8_ANACO|nr:unnamed protein product [Ananas comosus var. bracteatus]
MGSGSRSSGPDPLCVSGNIWYGFRIVKSREDLRGPDPEAQVRTLSAYHAERTYGVRIRKVREDLRGRDPEAQVRTLSAYHAERTYGVRILLRVRIPNIEKLRIVQFISSSLELASSQQLEARKPLEQPAARSSQASRAASSSQLASLSSSEQLASLSSLPCCFPCCFPFSCDDTHTYLRLLNRAGTSSISNRCAIALSECLSPIR